MENTAEHLLVCLIMSISRNQLSVLQSYHVSKYKSCVQHAFVSSRANVLITCVQPPPPPIGYCRDYLFLFLLLLFRHFHFYKQVIVNKKCQKFDYGTAGNKQHYHQVSKYVLFESLSSVTGFFFQPVQANDQLKQTRPSIPSKARWRKNFTLG